MACFYGVIPSIFKMLFLLSAFILSLSPNCSLIELSKNCLNVVLWVSFPTYMLLCRSVALKSTKIIRGGAWWTNAQLFGLPPWRCWCRSRAGHQNFDLAKFLRRDQRWMNPWGRQESLWPGPTLESPAHLLVFGACVGDGGCYHQGAWSELSTPLLSLQLWARCFSLLFITWFVFPIWRGAVLCMPRVGTRHGFKDTPCVVVPSLVVSVLGVAQ